MEYPQLYPFWIDGQLGLLWPKIMKSYISASTLSIFSKTLQYDIEQWVNKSDLTMYNSLSTFQKAPCHLFYLCGP